MTIKDKPWRWVLSVTILLCVALARLKSEDSLNSVCAFEYPDYFMFYNLRESNPRLFEAPDIGVKLAEVSGLTLDNAGDINVYPGELIETNGDDIVFIGQMPQSRRYIAGMSIRINAAASEDLEILPGVGPVTASQILKTREELSGFRNADDLYKIPGLNSSVLKGLVSCSDYH